MQWMAKYAYVLAFTVLGIVFALVCLPSVALADDALNNPIQSVHEPMASNNHDGCGLNVNSGTNEIDDISLKEASITVWKIMANTLAKAQVDHSNTEAKTQDLLSRTNYIIKYADGQKSFFSALTANKDFGEVAIAGTTYQTATSGTLITFSVLDRAGYTLKQVFALDGTNGLLAAAASNEGLRKTPMAPIRSKCPMGAASFSKQKGNLLKHPMVAPRAMTRAPRVTPKATAKEPVFASSNKPAHQDNAQKSM